MCRFDWSFPACSGEVRRPLPDLMQTSSEKGCVCVAWLSFVYSPRLNEQLMWGEAGLSSLLMHAGFTGALLTGVHSSHTQSAQCGYAVGGRGYAKFFFLANGHCFDGVVLTGIFQLVFLNSVDGMLVVRAQQIQAANVNEIFWYSDNICMRNRQLLPNLPLAIFLPPT